MRTDTVKDFHSGMVRERKDYLQQFLFGWRFWFVSGKDRRVWVLSSCNGVFLMSTSTSLLIILYIEAVIANGMIVPLPLNSIGMPYRHSMKL